VLDVSLFRAIVFKAVLPNLHFDRAATIAEQTRVKGLISPVYDRIKAGQVIISRGARVTPLDDQRIKSYVRATEERFGRPSFLVTFAGQLVVVSFLAILLVLFMRNNRPRIFFNDRKLMLVMLVFLTMSAIVVLVLKLTLFTREIAGLNYIFLVPACMLPIILSAFFDSRFAFFGNIVIAVFGGAIVPNGFEYFFIQLCGGTAAVYSLTRLRNRADFFISLSIILMTYMVTYIGYNFYARGSLTQIQYSNLALFGLNVILTLITYPLIYVFEKIFGLTSDLTFVELLDTNHPLLKELSVRAPGTFQHSLQVANITEAVLNRIGGNSLQAKVGALFHDIGKMLHPFYFIENLADHANPHDNINYSESAEVIIRHVSDGVALAHEYNLPAEVIDYIRTHHGTTRVEFFYRMQVESHPDDDVNPAAFSYPGPLPYTREMAVLMISDSIEAASRAMKDKSPDKLHALVENVVDSKVRQRQFAKAYLTFKDLEDAKQVIYNMLVSIYHGRIEYPDAPKEPETIQAEDARDSD
jgi:cyclic-di-AMP phosphodiesterase PgpH